MSDGSGDELLEPDYALGDDLLDPFADAPTGAELGDALPPGSEDLMEPDFLIDYGDDLLSPDFE